ncbi:CHY zinc finger protein [Endozoicomonas sp. 8E]|uniref:CHY zinc finger protein n=1 Tax=Endozoicomonas sp. 8E TaxID=3035692 RepID=UPI0029392CCD|nr:CHY zinc finger protein [Endozoicomonas sp. 8E]WOG27562.1 CHY zinc finger protein [Endozoicomonas sp. 8E]
MQLCHSATIIERHYPDGRRARIEINHGTDPQGVSQWQMSLLLPEDFDDQNSTLCFKAPVVSADRNSIALLVKNDLGNYCYQLVIVAKEQTYVSLDVSKSASKSASENSTLVRLKSTTADKPELASVTTNNLLNGKSHATPLTFLVYSDNMTDSGLEAGQNRNSTLAMTGERLAGNADFSGGGNGGFFYSPPPPWGGGGRASGLFEIDLIILRPVINWLMSMGKDSSSPEEQPSPTRLKITRVNGDGSSSEAVIPLGWLDFLSTDQLTDVNFWNTLFQRAAISCPASESLHWQLGCLKRFFEHTALKTDHAGGLKAVNEGGEPSGKLPDEASKEESNDHQKEKKGEPEDQGSGPPGEGNSDNGDGNNRKDDNGKESEKNTKTQDLQVIANQLVALIESDNPDAVFMLRQILDGLDMPQRLQVLETKGTNTQGNTVTPLEAILKLQRSFYENSTRNRFIEQLIEATSDQSRTLDNLNFPSERQPMIPPDRSMPQAGDNNLMILYKIVQDIINRFNQSDPQPSIGHFEKSCFTEYLVQLLLLYSNPLESIRELLGKISDSVIRHDIMISTQSLTFSTPFRAILIQLDQHPSFHELERLSNELIRQALTSLLLQEPSVLVPLTEPVISNSDNTSSDTTTSNANRFTDSIQQVDNYQNASGSTGSFSNPPTERYLTQEARPKQPALAGQLNDASGIARMTDRHGLTLAPSAVTPGNASNAGGSPAMQTNGTKCSAYYQLCSSHNQEATPSGTELTTAVQKNRKRLCEHYNRLCHVNFKCCGLYFPCHKCHNESDKCKVTDCKAVDATRLQCSMCGYEGTVTENSQTCPKCNEQMSQYFCAICKHFTDTEKKPHHCDKCGLCRVEKDGSYHCDVCNTCLNIRLQDVHKCRENAGHDDCGICLEDVFRGGRVLPCSHIVHRECAIAIIQNEIRTCPVCRYPIYTQLYENNN